MVRHNLESGLTNFLVNPNLHILIRKSRLMQDRESSRSTASEVHSHEWMRENGTERREIPERQLTDLMGHSNSARGSALLAQVASLWVPLPQPRTQLDTNSLACLGMN
jgi:hypothetical protein